MEKQELSWAEIKAMWAETDRRWAETDRKWAETDRRFEETRRFIDKLDVRADGINTNVEGIAKSNGKFAEEYFFNSLERKKEFAGVHFDEVSNTFGGLLKMPDGNRLQDQFDIVMVNDKAVALIEIKYKADKEDVEELVTRKMKNFKFLFPNYKDFKIYLGLGSLSFNDFVRAEAKKYGIGLLKQVGETIEYKADWEVRAY